MEVRQRGLSEVEGRALHGEGAGERASDPGERLSRRKKLSGVGEALRDKWEWMEEWNH